MPADAIDLEALAGLLAKASPPPWSHDGGYRVRRADGTCITEGKYTFDCALIAAAVDALPALLTAVRSDRQAHVVAWALSAGGWTVERTSLYDEEGVEGWLWKGWAAGGEYEAAVIGAHDEAPEPPEAVLEAYRAAAGPLLSAAPLPPLPPLVEMIVSDRGDVLGIFHSEALAVGDFLTTHLGALADATLTMRRIR